MSQGQTSRHLSTGFLVVRFLFVRRQLMPRRAPTRLNLSKESVDKRHFCEGQSWATPVFSRGWLDCLLFRLFHANQRFCIKRPCFCIAGETALRCTGHAPSVGQAAHQIDPHLFFADGSKAVNLGLLPPGTTS